MQLNPAIRSAIYFLAAVALAGLALLSWTQHRIILRFREQNQSQRETLNELDRLHVESPTAQLLQNDPAELERLRKNTSELLRLRHETAVLREQLTELSTLRAANAQLLQALQRMPNLQSNQQAQLMAARKQGALLGITISPAVVSADDTTLPTKHGGVIVTSIDADSPVAQSGLTLGDEIIAVDGRRVGSLAELQTEMLIRKPGDTVVLVVMRAAGMVRVEVKTRAWTQ